MWPYIYVFLMKKHKFYFGFFLLRDFDFEAFVVSAFASTFRASFFSSLFTPCFFCVAFSIDTFAGSFFTTSGHYILYLYFFYGMSISEYSIIEYNEN